MKIFAGKVEYFIFCGILTYFKAQETRAINHSNTYKIDYGKLNDDRIKSDLSNSEVNKNISSRKYDTGEKYKTAEEVRTEQKASWEQYKRDNPRMPLR